MMAHFLLFSHKIILFFFGLRYEDSVPVFNWLLLGFIANTVSTSIRMVLYPMNKLQVLTMIDILKLIIMIPGCYILIPLLGVLAPAILVFIVNIIGSLFLFIYVSKLIKKGDVWIGY